MLALIVVVIMVMLVPVRMVMLGSKVFEKLGRWAGRLGSYGFPNK